MSIALAQRPRVRRRRAPRAAPPPAPATRAPNRGAAPLPLALTALVLFTALAPSATLRTLDGADAPMGARLTVPLGYVLLSPLCRLFDALTLLSTSQHVALAATVLAAAALSGVGAARGTLRPRWTAVRLAAVRSGLALGALAAAYVGATLLPRPTAALAVPDADEVRVDFHSHTSASHDVPRWFTPARRREWAQATGFDVAFVSDHRSFAGAAAAMRANPGRAGEGLVIAPALEGWFDGVHVVLLGVTPADTLLLAQPHLDDVLPAALRDGRLRRAPIAIATIPDAVLPFLRPGTRDGAPFVRAVELVDGAPRAIAQSDRERPAIAARADRLGLIPIASSNHHGWGRTAVAWTLVRVPGWRAMPPDTLAARIVDVLRRGDARAVRVVERERPVAAGSGAARAARLAFTVPVLAWQTLTALEPAERGVWLLWTWVLAFAVRGAALRIERRRIAGRPVLVTA